MIVQLGVCYEMSEERRQAPKAPGLLMMGLNIRSFHALVFIPLWCVKG